MKEAIAGSREGGVIGALRQLCHHWLSSASQFRRLTIGRLSNSNTRYEYRGWFTSLSALTLHLFSLNQGIEGIFYASHRSLVGSFVVLELHADDNVADAIHNLNTNWNYG